MAGLRSARPASSASSSAVWISDALLAGVFVRFFSRRLFHSDDDNDGHHFSHERHHSHHPHHHARRFARRFASNVPGPLESRRRLGKRQLTELQLQPPQHPAATSLPVFWTTTQPGMDRRSQGSPPAPPWQTDQWQWPGQGEGAWEWSPPRVRGGRDGQEDGMSFWSSLPSWLSEKSRAARGEQQTEESSFDHGSYSATSQPFFSELNAWAEDRRDGRSIDSREAFATICASFRTQLRLASLSADEASDALHRLCAAVADDEAASLLLQSVVGGTRSCRLLEADRLLGPSFWQRLWSWTLSWYCGPDGGYGGQEAAAAAVAAVLLATPPKFVGQMDLDAVLVPLLTVAVTASTARVQEPLAGGGAHPLLDLLLRAPGQTGAEEGGKCRRGLAEAMADTLRDMDHVTIWEAVTARLLEARLDAQNQRHARRCWLDVLARLPQVRQATLFAAMQSFSVAAQDAVGPPVFLSRLDMCELLLAQWQSRGYVGPDVLETFHQWQSTESGCLAALALALFACEQSRPFCFGLYVSLGRCLQQLGWDAPVEMVCSVEAMAGQDTMDHGSRSLGPLLSAPFLETLASAANDLPAALRLHELYMHQQRQREWKRQRQRHAAEESQRQGQDLPARPWSIAFWDKFAGRLLAALDSGTLRPGQVSYALGMSAAASKMDAGYRQRQTGERPVSRPGPCTVDLVVRLAGHYALSDLPARRALRGVEQCHVFLRRHGLHRRMDRKEGGESRDNMDESSVLRAMFHVITRDLEAGRPGRTSRLRWFLALVEREHGDAVASVSGQALERWRRLAVAEGSS